MFIKILVKYVSHYSNQYVCQHSVPADLRDYFGKSKISIPLKTDKLALEALQLRDEADKVFLSEALEINFKIEGRKATPKRR